MYFLAIPPYHMYINTGVQTCSSFHAGLYITILLSKYYLLLTTDQNVFLHENDKNLISFHTFVGNEIILNYNTYIECV